MTDYKKLTTNDLLKLNDYMSNLELELKKLNILITYNLEDSRYMETYANAHIFIPEIQNSRFFTLFPLGDYFGICNLNLTRKNSLYRVSQEFKIGSEFNNKEFLIERVFEIGEGDEWKLKQAEEARVIIPVEETLGISRNLIKELLGKKKFKEVDERKVSDRWVRYRPFPSLAHRFGIPYEQDFYCGSEICLKDELVKNLNECSLKDNLVKFYNFFHSKLAL